MLNFRKIRPVRADRRTDMTKQLVDFVSFSNLPKKKVMTEGMTGDYNNLTESVAHPLFFTLHAFALYSHVKQFRKTTCLFVPYSYLEHVAAHISLCPLFCS
jgi:hypothetical protein